MSARALSDKDVRLQRDVVPSAQSSQLHWLHLLSHRTSPTLTHPPNSTEEKKLDACVCVREREREGERERENLLVYCSLVPQKPTHR